MIRLRLIVSSMLASMALTGLNLWGMLLKRLEVLLLSLTNLKNPDAFAG